VKSLLDDHGLAVPALVGDFADVPPAVAGPAAYLERLRLHLDACRDLGTPRLRVDTVSPSPGPPEGADADGALARVAEVWRRAAEEAAGAGVELVWEFEAAFRFNAPSEIVRLVQAVGHPAFTVLFDFFHAFCCAVLGARQRGGREVLAGGVEELAAMLAGRIGLVHWSDAAHGPGGPPGVPGTRVAFGAGELDLDAATRAVLAAGYDGAWWSIDLGALCPDALAAAPAAKRFMDGLVARVGGKPADGRDGAGEERAARPRRG